MIDIAVATVGLILLTPVLLGIALAVRFWLGSPMLFRQSRPGRHGKLFIMLKFRTMTKARDSEGRPLPDGVRLTKLGIFLRRFSLDELPQLWNVLRGDMSLVGPRPLLARYYKYFSPIELTRFNVRPGITGLAQIMGRNDLSWDARLAADVQYVQRISVWSDLGILATTVRRVFSHSGYQDDPGAVMLDFDVARGAQSDESKS
jgi:sugar transferase EpsL